MKTLRGIVLLAGFFAVTVAVMPIQRLALALKSRQARTIPYRYHRFVCWWLGIRVHVKGKAHHSARLIASNHTSWLDIPILSAVEPVSFVAKSEVAGWPFFGLLAKLQRTVFVERERRTRTAHSRNEIHARICDGDTLILFPEGTSSDGNRVLPFKSALMSVAQLALVSGEEDREEDLVVQPVSVAYTRLHGVPMGRRMRPYFAWYGDMDLFPHLFEAFSLGPIDVVVEYHEPVTIREVGTRKALAAYCEGCCRAGLVRALAGRPREAQELAGPARPSVAAAE